MNGLGEEAIATNGVRPKDKVSEKVTIMGNGIGAGSCHGRGQVLRWCPAERPERSACMVQVERMCGG